MASAQTRAERDAKLALVDEYASLGNMLADAQAQASQSRSDTEYAKYR